MDLFKALLGLHIATGGLSLLLGAYILAVRKGGKQHRRLGNVYFLAMLAASLVALPLSRMHPNSFLFIIGVFTSYMLISGKRYMAKHRQGDVAITDWVLSATMLVFAILFMCLGVQQLVFGNFFGIVFLVFGAIGLLFVYQDWVNFTGRSSIKNYGLTMHLQRMIGSYIASATAFVVVNNTVLPGVVAWLLPTAIMVPLIIKWTRKYKVSAKQKAGADIVYK